MTDGIPERIREGNYAADVREYVNAVLCPHCGQPATKQKIVEIGGAYYVAPSYMCDTPDCPFSEYTGESAWTLVLRI